MISRQTYLCLASVSLMMLASGCYYHNPYGYGYNGGMGGYPPPGGVIQSPDGFGPAPTVVPDGGTFQGGPTLAPEEGNWNSSNGGNDAPDFNSGVPDYPDNGTDTFNNNDLGSPSGDGDFFDSDPTGSVEMKSGVEQVAFETEDFQEPKKLQPIPEATMIQQPVASSPMTATAFYSAASFDYDKEQYSWLKGVADYDSKNKTWHIMYNLKPGTDDQFGGEFAMTDHEGLKTLKNGDSILVKGYVDDSDRDAYGKVIYRVEEITRLENK